MSSDIHHLLHNGCKYHFENSNHKRKHQEEDVIMSVNAMKLGTFMQRIKFSIGKLKTIAL
jgi:hypothetical protein